MQKGYNKAKDHLDALTGGKGGLIIGLSLGVVTIVGGVVLYKCCCKKDDGEMDSKHSEGGYHRDSLLVKIEEA